MTGKTLIAAKPLDDDDLQMMAQVFQLPLDAFLAYLKMGPGMAWGVLEVTGLPALEMFCDYSCYFPEEGKGRCMLWDEYIRLAG